MDIVSFPLDEFLRGEVENHELQRSDVVLIQSKGSLFGWAIRWATRSQFTHAALIFAIPHTNQGFNRAFIIESSTGGVDLTALDLHTDYPSHKEAVVIMRLERPWFDEDLQRRIRGEMLNSIKANYDYHSIGRLVLAIGTSMLMGRRSRAVALIKDIIRERFRVNGLLPMRFICSGFVQFGFWHTVRSSLPEIDKSEVYFGPPVEEEVTDADLLTITPEELFQSDKLAVKYVIAGQRVYPVNDREECLALLRSAESRKLNDNSA
jgi:hypothetical protein